MKPREHLHQCKGCRISPAGFGWRRAVCSRALLSDATSPASRALASDRSAPQRSLHYAEAPWRLARSNCRGIMTRMRDIRTPFAVYAADHQTPGIKLLRRVGIPLILLSLLGTRSGSSTTWCRW